MAADRESMIDEATGKERFVQSWCKRCYPDGPEPPVMLMSPTGVAHHCSGYGMTDCGHDATNDRWWWRL